MLDLLCKDAVRYDTAAVNWAEGNPCCLHSLIMMMMMRKMSLSHENKCLRCCQHCTAILLGLFVGWGKIHKNRYIISYESILSFYFIRPVIVSVETGRNQQRIPRVKQVPFFKGTVFYLLWEKPWRNCKSAGLQPRSKRIQTLFVPYHSLSD